METFDYYKVLQVDPSAEPEVIAAAYRRLALKYHPDANKAVDATRRMQEINRADETLSDTTRRASYDRERALLQAKSQTVGDKHEPQPPKEEPNKHKWQLIYRSDFNTPSDSWGETISDDDKVYRKIGYFHIAIYRSPHERYQCKLIPIADFRVYVDAQFAKNSGTTSQGGIVFRLSSTRDKDNNYRDNYYRFGITNSGYYALHLFTNGGYKTILDYRFSENIRRDDGLNSLMLQMVGKKIRLGCNGHMLASIEDGQLTSGNVGLFVASHIPDAFAETRFRDFRLYTSVESTYGLRDLRKADLRKADLRKADLRGANLRGANLSGADLYLGFLLEADLTGADLSGANLSNTVLFEADLTGANLTGANLSTTDLTGADLTRAKLTDSFLTSADLTEANLTGADLSGADLSGANLSTTDLSEADLSGANLTGAYLTRVDLTGADLTRAAFTDVRITEEQLSKAKSLQGATMPDGTKHD
jgi:uncharacterized protein YjbI with pentapeptide repeats